MKKKSILLIVALVLTCLLVGCGDESSSSDKNSDTAIEDLNTATSDNNEVSEIVEEPAPEDSTPETKQIPEEEEVQELIENENYVEVTGDTVRVRSSISTESNDNIIGLVDKGEKLVKTGDEEDWSKVTYEGQEGFIKSEFLKDISKEEYDSGQVVAKAEPTEEKKTSEEPAKQDTTETKNTQQQQDDTAAQQAALLAQQQAALLAQQQEALAAQAASAQTTSNNSGGGGSAENTQLRSDRIVYITPTGKKYHYDQQCAGKNAIPKNLDDVSGSYGPCGTCVLQ